jgi:hypothetical protein
LAISARAIFSDASICRHRVAVFDAIDIPAQQAFGGGGRFVLLNALSLMEKVFYGDFKDRLQLDPDLCAMREQFHRTKEAERQRLIAEFNIQPPSQAAASAAP